MYINTDTVKHFVPETQGSMAANISEWPNHSYFETNK